MFKAISTCRACGLGKPSIPTLKESTSAGGAYATQNPLIQVFDLGVQPLANNFVEPGQEQAGFAPLKVMFCPKCTNAQLSVVVNPDILYKHYLYVTSPSQTMQDHFAALLKVMQEEQSVLKVLEIGSNDGAFLKFLRENSASSVMGVDPASNLAAEAGKNHIATLQGIWSRQLAEDAGTYFKSDVDIIIARHVFCHVEDWQAFIHNLLIPSKKDTLVCIEVPYVKDLLQNGEFDTIYHEHTSYLSIKAMSALLAGSPWRLHRIQKFPVHGGAILLMLRRHDYEGKPHPSVEEFLSHEKITLETWKEFSDRANKKIGVVSAFVRNLRSNGKTVVGFGASAKSTVWINACGFSKKEISFITDTTPQKLWKTSPGRDIKIVDEGAILRELPDYALCFAWNFATEILEKNKLARSKGVKFIFPHPELQVI